MASINASTSGGGGVITTADATGNLNIQSGGSTVVAVTSTGVAVTGTLAVSGGVTLTTTLPVLQGGTGVTTSTGTGAGVHSVGPSISSAVMTTMASSVITSGTAVSASGTAVNFTGIPSWVKRITLMFDNISTSGSASAVFLIRIGNASFTTTGYTGSFCYTGVATGGAASTVGFPMMTQNTADIHSGQATINLLSNSSFKYTFSSTLARTDGIVCFGGSAVTLGALLDRVQVTTSNGTDIFDAGTINILYE
jgi:hypothetical protein